MHCMNKQDTSYDLFNHDSVEFLAALSRMILFYSSKFQPNTNGLLANQSARH